MQFYIIFLFLLKQIHTTLKQEHTKIKLHWAFPSASVLNKPYNLQTQSQSLL